MARDKNSANPANRGRPKKSPGILPEGTLGPLESEVMQVVWRGGEVTTRDVHLQLSNRREIAYTTVMTVMGNLTKKGLLERRLEDKAYFYRAAVSQEQLTHSRVSEVITNLLDRFSGPAFSTLLDKLDTIDEARLEELEARVAKLRHQRTRWESSSAGAETSKDEGQG